MGAYQASEVAESVIQNQVSNSSLTSQVSAPPGVMRLLMKSQIQEELQRDTMVIAKGVDPRYGNITMYRFHRTLERSSQSCLEKQVSFSNDSPSDRIIHYVKTSIFTSRSKFINPNPIQAPISTIWKVSLPDPNPPFGYCATIVMDYFSDDLNNLIKKLRDSAQQSSDSLPKCSLCLTLVPRVDQILALLKSLCLVYKHYSIFGMNHGDIQPQTVHLNICKFAQVLENPVLFPLGPSNLAKSVFDQKYLSALSPVQAELLRAGVNNSNIHTSDDLWGIGVTVLCYASLRPLEYFYSRDGTLVTIHHINEVLSECISSCQDTSRKEVLSLLAMILCCEIYKRPGVDQILNHAYLRGAKAEVNLEEIEELQTFGVLNSPLFQKTGFPNMNATLAAANNQYNSDCIQNTSDLSPRKIFDENSSEENLKSQNPISVLIQKTKSRIAPSQLLHKKHIQQLSQIPTLWQQLRAPKKPSPLSFRNPVLSAFYTPRLTNDSLAFNQPSSSKSLNAQQSNRLTASSILQNLKQKQLPILNILYSGGEISTHQSSRASIGPKLPFLGSVPRKKSLEEKFVDPAEEVQTVRFKDPISDNSLGFSRNALQSPTSIVRGTSASLIPNNLQPSPSVPTFNEYVQREKAFAHFSRSNLDGVSNSPFSSKVALSSPSYLTSHHEQMTLPPTLDTRATPNLVKRSNISPFFQPPDIKKFPRLPASLSPYGQSCDQLGLQSPSQLGTVNSQGTHDLHHHNDPTIKTQLPYEPPVWRQHREAEATSLMVSASAVQRRKHTSAFY